MQKNKNSSILILAYLRTNTKKFEPPLIDTIIAEFGKKPFLILIACLLSLRSKDRVTIHICRNLFKKAQTPQELLAIEKSELERLIFKIGFYRVKAKVLHEVTSTIHKKFNDQVPKTYDELVSIKGVGPKTANLVLGLAYGIPAICVDVHVHRISNRLGIIKTKTPEQTEQELKKIFEKKNWIEINKLLVMWGQNICAPRSPKCSQCAISFLCAFYAHHYS